MDLKIFDNIYHNCILGFFEPSETLETLVNNIESQVNSGKQFSDEHLAGIVKVVVFLRGRQFDKVVQIFGKIINFGLKCSLKSGEIQIDKELCEILKKIAALSYYNLAFQHIRRNHLECALGILMDGIHKVPDPIIEMIFRRVIKIINDRIAGQQSKLHSQHRNRLGNRLLRVGNVYKQHISNELCCDTALEKLDAILLEASNDDSHEEYEITLKSVRECQTLILAEQGTFLQYENKCSEARQKLKTASSYASNRLLKNICQKLEKNASSRLNGEIRDIATFEQELISLTNIVIQKLKRKVCAGSGKILTLLLRIYEKFVVTFKEMNATICHKITEILTVFKNLNESKNHCCNSATNSGNFENSVIIQKFCNTFNMIRGENFSPSSSVPRVFDQGLSGSALSCTEQRTSRECFSIDSEESIEPEHCSCFVPFRAICSTLNSLWLL